MARPRNTYRYVLKQGHRIVYRGITNNPERRETEHRLARKRFTKLTVVGPSVTRPSAEKWESDGGKSR
jgi:predicted GIY-YIG superfamily endonuclease